MLIWQALVLSVVEAITEFLPVSSTAHLILTSKLLGITSSDFLSSFEIFIQLGAILAVAVAFFSKLWINKKSWSKIMVAFLPAVGLGLVFYKLVKFLLQGQAITGIFLILGGLFFIIFEQIYNKKQEQKKTDTALINVWQEIDSLSYKRAFLIGLMQVLAFVPGVSRSAATTFGGLANKLSKKAAVEFSFLLAIPTMLAASGYDLLQTILDGAAVQYSSSQWLVLGVGLLATFLVSLCLVKTLIKAMQGKYSWTIFGIYRLAAGIFWLFVI
jgi:undecaprenyl-diphosphatase